MAVPDTAAHAGGRRVLDHAVRLLVGHAGGGEPWRFGPLVILSVGDRAATTSVQEVCDVRDAVFVRDGGLLDREIAAALAGDRLDRLATTLETSRFIVVDRIDRVAPGPRRDALVHLFDASSAAGAIWCVSTPSLRGDTLGDAVASRLTGGLVVVAPEAATVAAGGTPPSMGRVLRTAARHHDVPVAALSGPARDRTVSAARSLAMYLARRLTGLSLHAIGAACGGRDHTTVLHGTRVCAARVARDPAYAADVERIAAELATPGAATHRRRRGVGSRALGRALTTRRRDRRRQA